MLWLAVLPLAHAWGHHYLMAARSLEHPDLAWLDQPVEVEDIDTLLAVSAPALGAAIQAHYDWLEARGSERFVRQRLPETPDLPDFWRALRLNPGANLPLVVRALPGDEPGRYGEPIAPTEASPYLVEKGGLLARVERVQPGDRLPGRVVVSTFVDEPDWGFDHELWPFQEYGYGAQPYGKPEGESSKAPFHMQFRHENALTVAFSDAEEGMVIERVDLFLRLSQAAFQSGHPYWGLRFSAWAAHYAQDLTQPYHSRAIPGVGFGWYIRYVLSPTKERMSGRITQIEANRHFVYEDFVATALQRGYLGEDPTARALDGYLRGQGEFLDQVQSAEELVADLCAVAARHAKAIDKALFRAFPRELMKNPDYDVETAPDYDISKLLPAVPPDRAEVLLEETGQDFQRAGIALRSVLRLSGAKPALMALGSGSTGG